MGSPRADADAAKRAGRVLVVDDERDVADALNTGLEQGGFSVDVFNDSVEAVANFKPHTYSLIIRDIKMPKMNGFEMVYEMQRIDSDPQVFFFTGHIDIYQELSKLFGKLKVREVIEKPISMKRLLEKIDRMNASRATSATQGEGTIPVVMTKNRHMQDSLGKPRQELLELVLETTRQLPGTLGAISQAIRPSLEFSWQEFTEAVDYLASRGDLQARGNGFDVIYSVIETIDESHQRSGARKSRNHATAF